MTFRFVLVSILVQRKFTTDRYVVYKMVGFQSLPLTDMRYINGWVESLVLRRKARDFLTFRREDET